MTHNTIMFHNNNFFIKSFCENENTNSNLCILVAKWNPYIGYWTCCIGLEDNEKLNTIKEKFGLSDYHSNNEFDFFTHINYVCFDTLHNQDRNIGPMGEEGWCCYKDKTKAKNIITKDSIFDSLQQMIIPQIMK
jgi:hypothetical protein